MGEAVRDARAAIVADEDHRGEPERPDHIGDVGRHVPLVVAADGRSESP